MTTVVALPAARLLRDAQRERAQSVERLRAACYDVIAAVTSCVRAEARLATVEGHEVPVPDHRQAVLAGAAAAVLVRIGKEAADAAE